MLSPYKCRAKLGENSLMRLHAKARVLLVTSTLFCDLTISRREAFHSLLPSTSKETTQIIEGSTVSIQASLCKPQPWMNSECFRATTLPFSLVAGNRQYAQTPSSSMQAELHAQKLMSVDKP
jgi:hypothetical protein